MPSVRFAAAVAGGDQRDLVARRLVGQREGDAGGQRVEHRGAAVLALQALVALDAAVGGVAGLAFLVDDLHAVDAALGVDQLAGSRHSRWRRARRSGRRRRCGRPAPGRTAPWPGRRPASRCSVQASAAAEQWPRCEGTSISCLPPEVGSDDALVSAASVLLDAAVQGVAPQSVRRDVNAGTATAAASPCRWTTAGPGRAARRSGRTRSARRRS